MHESVRCACVVRLCVLVWRGVRACMSVCEGEDRAFHFTHHQVHEHNIIEILGCSSLRKKNTRDREEGVQNARKDVRGVCVHGCE